MTIANPPAAMGQPIWTCSRPQAPKGRNCSVGKSSREIIRCLKRYVAREVYAVLTAA